MNTISSSLASLQSALAESSTTNARSPAARQSRQSTSNIPVDIVQMNPAQQAQRLYYTGYTVPQIAFSLEMSIQAVNNYLRISKTSQ